MSINNEATLYEKELADFSRELLSILSEEDELQKLSDIGYKYIGLPVIIAGSNGNALAISPDIEIPEDPSWTEFRRDRQLSSQSIITNIKSELITNIENDKHFFIHKDRSMAYRRMIESISYKNSLIGSISIVEYERDFSDRDLSMLSLLHDAVCIEIRKKKTFPEQSALSTDLAIKRILDGEPEETDIPNLSNILTLNQKSVLRLFTMDIKGMNTWRDSAPYLRLRLKELFPEGLVSMYGNYMFVAASYDSKDSSDSIYQNNLKKFKEFLELYNLKGGVSRAFLNIASLRTFFDQAAEAMEIGMQLDKSRRLNLFDDYEIYHIAHICSMNNDLIEFVYPRLIELMQYDSAHKTNYTENLYIFLKYSRNLTEAAKVLHMHRNTLIYQLKKIDEILGIKMSEGDHMLLFELSFKFMEYNPKLGGNYFEKLKQLL